MDFVLPPSPNWNCSRILDCDGSGNSCFGSNHGVYFMDLSVSTNPCPTLVAMHQGRVNGVSIHKLAECSEKIICSGAVDCSVKVTKVSHNKEHKLLNEHRRHKSSVCVVHCNPSDSNIVASGDDKGVLIVFNHTTNEFCFNHSHSAILGLVFAPGNSQIIAIGLKTGIIMILKFNKKSLEFIHKLPGHNEEIQSLRWLMPAQDTKSPPLLSLGRDKMVRVWDVEDGTMKKEIVFEPQLKYRRWHALSSCVWSSEHFIISGSNGEMYLWNINEPEPRYLQAAKGKGHTKAVINISTWLNADGVKMAISVSIDRLIVVWNVDEMRAIFNFPTFGGFVYSIKQSPVSPDKFAVGVGDSTVRIFNILNNNCSNSITHDCKFKVTTLSWHPHNEKMLAFGTEEGTVAILEDASMTSRANIQISTTFHKREVHSLVWGPKLGEKNRSHMFLYSVGDMVAYAHNPSDLKSSANDVEDAIMKRNPAHMRTNVSELSFSPDFRLVAVGCEDGSIFLHEVSSLTTICKIIHCKKIINNISWHLSSTLDQDSSTSSSSLSNQISVASNSNDVYIFDLKNVITEWKISRTTFVVTECLMVLQGHQNRISKVAWSPGQENLLASASSDGTVQIWDVLKKRGISNYRGHLGKVLSLAWNGEFIYSGGDDFTFHAWRFNDLHDDLPPKEKHYKSKYLSMVTNVGHPDDAESRVGGRDNGENKIFKDSSSVSENTNKEDNISENTRIQKELKSKRKLKSLFPLSSLKENSNKHNNQLDSMKLASILYSQTKQQISLDDDSAHLGCFTDRRGIDKMFKKEIQHHKENENQECRTVLEVFRGTGGEFLREMAERRLLDDHIVSMSFAVSPEFAEEMFVAYANQLVEEKSYLKASTYLLGAGRIEEAIGLLLDKKLHKEAMCLAKARLNPSNPLLRTCYLSAAEASAHNGNFEYASKCLLALGKSKEAISMILRRSGSVSLGMASSVAKETGDVELASTYACRYVIELMQACDWSAAEEFLESFHGAEHLNLLLSCHKALLSFIEMPEIVDTLKSNPREIDSNAVSSIVISGLEDCMRKWMSFGLLENIDISDIHKQLLVIHHTRQSNQDFQNILVDVSLCLVLFISEHLTNLNNCEDDEIQVRDESNHWLLDALIKLESANSDCLPLLLFNFCSVLFPDGDCCIENLVKKLRRSFFDVIKNSQSICGNECLASGLQIQRWIGVSDHVRKVISMLDIFSREREATDHLNEPITVACCIRARCCQHSLKMLLHIISTTQQSELELNGRINEHQTTQECSNYSAIIDPTKTDINMLLLRVSHLLLRQEPAKVQTTLKTVEHLNTLIKDFISRGGCQGNSNNNDMPNLSLHGKCGGDTDKKSETVGNSKENEDVLEMKDMNLPVLAQKLHEGRQTLSLYPDFYKNFPDCEKSKEMISEITERVLSSSL